METHVGKFKDIDREASSSELTPKYAGRIVFFSYKYSQGLSHVQRSLFKYVHILHPDWNIPDEAFEQKATSLAQHSAKEFLLDKTEEKHPKTEQHDAVRPEGIDASVANQMEIMRKIFNSEEPIIFKKPDGAENEMDESRKGLVEYIAAQTVEEDLKYFRKEEGRPREVIDPSKFSQDPWRSHFIDYALSGKKTGVAEYDILYEDMRRYMKEGKADESQGNIWQKEILPKVNEIIEVYNEHHPENQVAI